MIIPNKIKKGNTIGIIAPSGPIQDCDLEQINESINLLESYGFKIVFSNNAYENEWGYSASAKQKADDINNMFENKNIKAIIAATGGCNCISTFEYLNFETIRNNPKILCGFSDTTALTNIISEKCDMVTYNGATFKSLTSWNTNYAYKQFIKKFVEGNTSLFEPDDECFVINDGVAEGMLIGGNLSLITRLCSGKFKVNFKNKILFLEELYYESPPELVCENLFILKQNGVFDDIKGIWLGNYNGEVPLEKIIFDVLDNNLKIPIIKSNNFGHIDKKMVIPIGTKAKIDTKNEIKISLLEHCCN